MKKIELTHWQKRFVKLLMQDRKLVFYGDMLQTNRKSISRMIFRELEHRRFTEECNMHIKLKNEADELIKNAKDRGLFQGGVNLVVFDEFFTSNSVPASEPSS